MVRAAVPEAAAYHDHHTCAAKQDVGSTPASAEGGTSTQYRRSRRCTSAPSGPFRRRYTKYKGRHHAAGDKPLHATLYPPIL